MQFLTTFRKARCLWKNVRFPVQFVSTLFLLPALLLLLLRELVRTQTDLLALSVMTVGAAGLVTFYPWLIKRLWFTRPVEKTEIQTIGVSLVSLRELGVRDIRIVNTCNRFVLAMVIGLIPGTRTIFISDAMWDRFTRAEVAAVIRHELSHLKLNHFSQRLAWLVLPLVLIMTVYLTTVILVFAGRVNEIWFDLSLPPHEVVTMLAGAVVYIAYFLLVVRRRIIAMEFEADLESASTDDPVSATRDMQLALLRLSGFNPKIFNKASLFHPSVSDRIDKLNLSISTNPNIQTAQD